MLGKSAIILMKILGSTLQYLIAWAAAFPGFVFPGYMRNL